MDGNFVLKTALIVFVYKSAAICISAMTQNHYTIIEQKSVGNVLPSYEGVSMLECASMCSDHVCSAAGYNLNTNNCFLSNYDENMLLDISDPFFVVMIKGYVTMKDCSLPYSPTNGNFVHTGITHNSTVSYNCDGGYTIVGDQVSSCKDGTWDKLVPICMADCSIPSGLTNGNFVYTGTTHDSTVTYNCNSGYTLVGEQVSTCKDGTWDKPVPICMADCSLPSSPTNGNFVHTDITHDSTVTYNCDGGYTIVGDQVSSCKDGNWDKPVPTCMADCLMPSFSNGLGLFSSFDFIHGSTSTYSCNSGYTLNGEQISTCVDGTWDKPVPTCMADCPTPSFFSNGLGLFSNSEYIHGSTATYSCNSGYTLNGDQISTCVDGTWDKPVQTCVADAMQDCVAPSAPTYGSISGNVFTHGSDVVYNCDADYKLVGDNTTTCADGAWDGTLPTCVQDCGPITYPNINIDSIDDTTIDSTAVVSCKPGYQLRYSTVPVSVVCSDDGLGGVSWKAMTEEPECWELMFRGTEDNGHSAAKAYMYGIEGVTTTDTDCMLVQNNSCTQHYRNPQLDSWSTLGVRKIRYEMYNNGNVEMSLVMNGTGTTYTNWLFYDKTGPWRALEYPWTGLTEYTESWWALNDWDGDVSTGHGRTFRIIMNYGGCPVDNYYTVVLYEPNYGCNYENHPSWPKFLYTTTNTVSTFESEGYGMASVMAVWVYHD